MIESILENAATGLLVLGVGGIGSILVAFNRRLRAVESAVTPIRPRPDGTIPLLDRLSGEVSACRRDLESGGRKMSDFAKSIATIERDVSRILGLLERQRS